VERLLLEEFSRLIDFEGEDELPAEALSLADRIREELASEETLYEDTGRRHTFIKIREGVYLRLALGRVMGKDVGLELVLSGGRVDRIRFRGNPALKEFEEKLRGIPYESLKEEILSEDRSPMAQELLKLITG